MTQKLFGVKVSVSGLHNASFYNWYSTNEQAAAQNIEFAKNIPAPHGCESTFTPVSCDVTISEPGTYKLDNGQKVFLSHFSGIEAHGYMLKPNGALNMRRAVVFLINGESRLTKHKVVSKVYALDSKRA